MKMRNIVAYLAVCVMVLGGCASTPRAPKGSAGGDIEIVGVIDFGDPAEMNKQQYQWRVYVGNWMGYDLTEKLRQRGFKVIFLKAKENFVPAVDCYLLLIKIKYFHTASDIAKAFVGPIMAGPSLLNCHYEFYGNNNEIILSWDDGAASSREWKLIPAKLNKNAIKKIMQQLITPQ